MWNLTKDALQGSGARPRLRLGDPRAAPARGAGRRRARHALRAARRADPDLLHPFATRVGIQFTQGGRLLRLVRRDLLQQGSGALNGADGVVIVRNTPQLDGDEADAVDAFEDGLVRGLRAQDLPVVGVETTDAETSQIEWFKDHELSSVDDLDDPIGRAARRLRARRRARQLRREGDRRRRPAAAAPAVSAQPRPAVRLRGYGAGVHALPTLVAFAAALLLTPPILRHLQAEGFTRENYRGVWLPFPGGIAIVAAGVLALGACAALARLASDRVHRAGTYVVLDYTIGVALLGLIDDLLAGGSRGWRGHGRAVLAASSARVP